MSICEVTQGKEVIFSGVEGDPIRLLTIQRRESLMLGQHGEATKDTVRVLVVRFSFELFRGNTGKGRDPQVG